MIYYSIEGKVLEDLANAMRDKTGKEDALTSAEMVNEVEEVYVAGRIHGEESTNSDWIWKNINTIIDKDLEQITNYQFYGQTKVVRCDFSNLTQIGNTSLANIGRLTALILRKTDSIVTLRNANAFTNSGIATGRGYIYVPKALEEEYKSATNWSTYAARIRAIEDYPIIDQENIIITKQPEDVTVIENQVATLTVEAEEVFGNGGLNYAWYALKPSTNHWAIYTDGAGYNTAIVKDRMLLEEDGSLYRCEIRDAYGHVIYSREVKVRVIPA